MTNERKGGWLAGTALAAVSVVVSFVTCELIYRAYVNRQYQWSVDSFRSESWRIVPGSPLIFRLPANHDGKARLLLVDEYVPYRTNADGFRDPERGKKDAAVPRVLVLGDSYTFGWGVADGEPYPQRAEALLRSHGAAAEVLNAGVPGYNTEQESFLLAELMPEYKPDMVVVGYAMNDAEPQGNVPQPPAVTYRYAWSWMWEDCRELIMRNLAGQRSWSSPAKLAPGSDYVLGFAPDSHKWRESKAALEDIAAACRRARVPLLVLILPDFTRRFDSSYPHGMIHGCVSRWCHELGNEVVDLMPTFAGQDHRSFMISMDGHPNTGAHEIIGRVLALRIVAALHLTAAASARP